jgi:hypothetical protein
MSAVAVAAAASPELETYAAYGAVGTLFAWAKRYPQQMPPEILLKGPAGTGKSRGACEFLNWVASTWDGCRILMLRKTRRSLTESGMVTLEREVLGPDTDVAFRTAKQRYEYPNGSIIAVGGMDKPTKVMSSQWDVIYVLEVTELTEDEYEMATTRLRNGKTPFQLMLSDANPDSPTHWTNARALAGKLTILRSVHEDNPTLWDRQRQTWTERGTLYIAKLDQLSGVRYRRLRLGEDAGAEGTVYEGAWDLQRNYLQRQLVTGRRVDLQGDCGVPREWPRYWALDWGFTNPFVCQQFAQDHDGRLYLYREIYMSRRTVPEHAREILRACLWTLEGGRPVGIAPHADVLPRVVLYDPADPQAATLFQQATGLYLVPATKDIANGIQAVRARFQAAADGKPRLYYLRDSLVERDVVLADKKLPTCSAEEVDSYVWDTRGGQKRGELPMDANNHGMDCTRYLCTYLDVRANGVSYGKVVY